MPSREWLSFVSKGSFEKPATTMPDEIAAVIEEETPENSSATAKTREAKFPKRGVNVFFAVSSSVTVKLNL